MIDEKVYRTFFIHVSPVAPGMGEYGVRIGSGAPGGTPGYHADDKRRHDPDSFIVESDGARVNLLDALNTRTVTRQQLFRLGEILAGMILPGGVRARLLKDLKLTRERGEALRIRLHIEAPEFVPLPWEYLYLDGSRASGESEYNFLSLQPDVSIVRHEATGQEEPAVKRPDRGRYRLVAALTSAQGPRPLDVSGDRREIEVALKATREGEFEPVWVDGATPDSLFAALRDGADVFHFAGHGYFDGERGRIILDGGDGDTVEYDAVELGQKLQGARLAVLSACETAQTSRANVWGGVAHALVRAGLAAVVASQYRLSDANAGPLARELYRVVLTGGTVDKAISNARSAILNQSGLENRDWGSLVLYLNTDSGVVLPRADVPHAPGPAAARVPRVLPTPLQTALVGREDLLGAQASASGPRGTRQYFYGPFGVGKTSLLTELFTRAAKDADKFADGCLWYTVPRGAAVESVLEWIGAQLSDESVALGTDATAKINALRVALSRRTSLLIGLDDVSDPKIARAVLDAAGECTVMLNGSQPLDLGGRGRERELDPLSSDAAMDLFADTARRSLARMSEGEREEVRSICQQMGRLPLAVKLAAIRHGQGESLEVVRSRIEGAPKTLIGDHPEVSAIFEVSYEDLQKLPAAERMLARLATFPAREAPLGALRLGGDDLTFFEAKDALVRAELAAPAVTDRLVMHPLLGRLARAKMSEDIGAEERAFISGWLLRYANKYRNDYEALRVEHANLLAAFDWFDEAAKPAATVELIRDLFDYLRVRGHWHEALRRLEKAADFAHVLGRPSDEAGALLMQSVILMLRGERGPAESVLEQSDALYRQVKDKVGRGCVLYRLSTLNHLRGRLSPALKQARQSLRLLGKGAPARDRARAHANLAAILATRGVMDEARSHLKRALEVSRAAGEVEEEARIHASFGRLLRRAGEHEAALSEYRLASAQYDGLGHVRETARLNIEMGYLHYYRGEYDSARDYFDKARATFDALRDPNGLGQIFHAFGNLHFAKDELEEAEKQYRAALEINLSTESTLSAAHNKFQLALIEQRRDREGARASFREVEGIAKKEDAVALRAGALYQLANLSLAEGELKAARSDADESLRLAIGVEDHMTEVSAICLLGLIDAREGRLESGREKLLQAREALTRLRAPEAAKVERMLKELSLSVESGELVDAPDNVDADSLVAFDAPAVVDEGGTGAGSAAPVLVIEGGGAGIDVVAEGGSPASINSSEDIDLIVEGGEADLPIIIQGGGMPGGG